MSDQINDGGQAFPSQPWYQDFQPGMSLRDLFAGQALTGLIMSQWGKNSYVEFAKKSYAAADAMLFERSNYLKEAK